MAKPLLDIQRGWVSWLKDRQATDQFDATLFSLLTTALASEVEWILHAVDYADQLTLRLAKYTALLLAHDNDLSMFDPNWVYRRDFIQWMNS